MSEDYLGVDFRFDDEGDLVVNDDGDIAIVEGKDCLIQDILDRLQTVPGELWGHSKFGNDTATMLGEPDTELNRIRAVRGIRVALQQEERIDPETINVELLDYSSEIKEFEISFKIKNETELQTIQVAL